MVDFDKFEKDVKNKYGNQEFPFDEQNWEKAAKMIDASRRGKNRGGIFLLSAVALLCTSGLVYYFGFSDSTKALQKNNLASNQIMASEKETTTNNAASSENNSVDNTVANSNESSVASSSNNTPSNQKSDNEATTFKTTSEVKNNPSVRNSKTKELVTPSTSEKETNSEPKNEAETASKTSTASDNNPTNTTSTNSKTVDTKKPMVAKSDVKTVTPPVLGNNTNSQNNTKPVNPTSSLNETGNPNRLGDVADNSSTENPTKNSSSVTDSSNTVVTTSVKPTKSSVVDSVPAMRKSKADSLAAMLPKGDGVSYATNVKEKHNAKNILFMEAGTTYLLGWNGGGKTEAGGFNLLAGINFQHYFTGNIAAQIGVQYSTISNLTNSSHTISTVKYDLGVEQDITAIKYQKLHYLVAPVKLTFNAGDKNIFGIGCNVAYLLNSDSKKEKYKTYSSDPNATKNNLTSTKESGYVQGFNPFDIQVSVAYRRKLYKGLSANAEFFYGLTDTKNNSFFKSNYFDRNVGFKVSLCYDLFKK